MGKIIQRVRKGIVIPVSITAVSVGFAVYTNIENAKLAKENEELYQDNKMWKNESAVLKEENDVMKEEIFEYVIDMEEMQKALNEKETKINSLQKEKEGLEKKLKQQQQQNTLKSDYPTTGTDLGSFKASAYIAFCKEGCTGKTRTGYDVSNTIYYNGYRVIATDNSVIPMYSIVEVSYGDKKFKAIAIDTGGAIKGKKIDVLVSSYDEAIQFGRKSVNIKMIKRGKGL